MGAVTEVCGTAARARGWRIVPELALGIACDTVRDDAVGGMAVPGASSARV
ncbi:MAG: hypothetical protein ACYCUE_14995 [Steroidobacteraceae bacterium]